MYCLIVKNYYKNLNLSPKFHEHVNMSMLNMLHVHTVTELLYVTQAEEKVVPSDRI